MTDDARRLRKSLRKAGKIAKKLRQSLADADRDFPVPPRWLLTAEQLQAIARLAVTGAGYEQVVKALGIQGNLNLHELISETFRAAGCPGTRGTWGGAEAQQRWLLSYGDAETAYAWHLAVANDRTVKTQKEQ